MPVLGGNPYSRRRILQYTGDIRQLAGVRRYELLDGPGRGCRIYELYNGSGLVIPVLADLGMGIGDITYCAIPLSFKTAAGFVHPSYAGNRGSDMLKTFPGGFLTTCGLTQAGAPCTDGEEELALHGRAPSLPAESISHDCAWENDERYRIAVTGSIRESSLFGCNLVLTRTITAYMGAAEFKISDTVANEGYSDAPLMLLYHFNPGFPLVSEHAKLKLPPHSATPRDNDALRGMDSYSVFEKPHHPCREQVFFHDCKTDKRGFITVELANPEFSADFGVTVGWRYRKSDLPCLTQWKMTGCGAYVCGIEPGTCNVEGRVKERQAGRLQTIAAGETRTFEITVGIKRS